jgi:hypothetical protein
MSEWIDREESVFEFINAFHVDWQLDYFDSCSLVIIGNQDLCYYHAVEILFEEVLYVQFPSFLYDRLEIRLADPSEISQFQHLELDLESKLFAMSCPDLSPKSMYFIAAERIKVRSCIIHHYPNDKLQLEPCEEKWNRGRYRESILHEMTPPTIII